MPAAAWRKKLLAASPLLHEVAAVSVGIVDGEARLDLPYVEDSAAEVDMNIVMTGDGKLVEVQGTAEHGTFDRKQLDALVRSGDGRASSSWSRRSDGRSRARGA